MRHFRRETRGKIPVKHSSTLVDNTGPGVGSFFIHEIFKTDVGVRTTGGGVQNIQSKATTEAVCRVGDTIKYINICLECSPRGANPTDDNDNAGWLEWAVVYQKERAADILVTNIGVATIGVIASHSFREDCIMTGCFPLGTKQAMAQDIKLKIPRRMSRLKIGSIIRIFCYVRTSKSTDTRTDSHRLIASSHFKCYS